MNTFITFVNDITTTIQKSLQLTLEQSNAIDTVLNNDTKNAFGDVTCNAAMVLARPLKQSPREIAQKIKTLLQTHTHVESLEIAGPGFINIKLKNEFWQVVARELFIQKEHFFKHDANQARKKYLLEFVSGNPTGPLHLGHGRGGIIGDVLARVLHFLGHTACREYYINDAGTQIEKLGASLKARVAQLEGHDFSIPEGGYVGEYLIDLAKLCLKKHGKAVVDETTSFFSAFAVEHLMQSIEKTLSEYRVNFDSWFSEKTLHPHAIENVLTELKNKDLLYEKDNALWFKSSAFGDNADRVIKKSDGIYTYIAADIAYHKNKFDRGFDNLIVILGQDHHGYVTRLKATMQALGYAADNLEILLYQLVSIKNAGQAVRMSKRAGTFTELQDVIEEVGADVARFFYLNRKADAHLDFDLATALKRTDENPVYYIQYAYVRTRSIIAKAYEHTEFANADFLASLHKLAEPEITLLKKIISLKNVLLSIEHSYQTHLLSYYTIELAQHFHAYYTHNKVVNLEDPEVSKCRLFIVSLLSGTLEMCLDLLGLTKPEKM